jgi:choline kinase
MTGLKQGRNVSGVDASNCTAVLLAAGVGRRLGDSHDGPKVLLDFGGRSLLQRHIEALVACGVPRLMITVGYEAEAVHQAIAKLRAEGIAAGLQIGFVDNPDYRDGSLVSLHVQHEVMRSGGEIILMDGDVLYDPPMIARLLTSDHEGVLLLDREIEPGDEPVKICFDAAGAIVDFRKIPAHPYVRFGESVGFFRFSGAIAAALASRCAWYMAQGRVKTEYEEAIRDLLLAEPARFGAEDISDLPWTEIDFQEDVTKARLVILPQLER